MEALRSELKLLSCQGEALYGDVASTFEEFLWQEQVKVQVVGQLRADIQVLGIKLRTVATGAEEVGEELKRGRDSLEAALQDKTKLVSPHLNPKPSR